MTKVIFRKWTRKDFRGEIEAVFPEIPGTNDPSTFTVYAHVGQHSTGYLDWYHSATEPAQPQEYADLLAELKSIGYDDLQVIQKMPSNAIATRRKIIKGA